MRELRAAVIPDGPDMHDRRNRAPRRTLSVRRGPQRSGRATHSRSTASRRSGPALLASAASQPASSTARMTQRAVPMVVGGMARNASTDAGADALHSAAADHATDIGSILGHIFGSRQDQAAQGLGQASSLGTQNTGQLLAMSQKQGMDCGGLGGMLVQEAQKIGPGARWPADLGTGPRRRRPARAWRSAESSSDFLGSRGRVQRSAVFGRHSGESRNPFSC